MPTNDPWWRNESGDVIRPFTLPNIHKAVPGVMFFKNYARSVLLIFYNYKFLRPIGIYLKKLIVED